MMDLLPPVDWAGDAESWTAKVVELFARYPDPVMRRASHLIPERSSRPSVALIRHVLDEVNEPIQREYERALAAQRAAETRLLAAPRRKRTPEEQSRIDAQVAEARQRFGIPEHGMPDKFVPKPSDNLPIKAAVSLDDGNHAARIAADLERRRAINTERAAESEWHDLVPATDEQVAAAREEGITV